MRIFCLLSILSVGACGSSGGSDVLLSHLGFGYQTADSWTALHVMAEPDVDCGISGRWKRLALAPSEHNALLRHVEDSALVEQYLLDGSETENNRDQYSLSVGFLSTSRFDFFLTLFPDEASQWSQATHEMISDLTTTFDDCLSNGTPFGP